MKTHDFVEIKNIFNSFYIQKIMERRNAVTKNNISQVPYYRLTKYRKLEMDTSDIYYITYPSPYN